MAMSEKEKRVRRLERKFDKVNEELIAFEDEYEEVIDEYKDIIAKREASLKELEIAVRETRIGASGMTVSIIPRRTFDGVALYKRFKDSPEVRDSLIKVEYKVVSSKFDELQKLGYITGKDVDKFVIDVKETLRVNSKPASYKVG